ncbi:pyridoxamine 5'-phosphate oxidase [soil metagenome]
MSNIADLRRTYGLTELSESASSADPLKQFDSWLEQAIKAELLDATAMTVATVGPDMQPSTRIVLVKGIDERGLVWFTNRESRKGHELAANPRAALQFFWAPLERVVRIEGVVELVSDEESDTYYASRPLGSRIGAWASPQSEVIASRDVLVEKTREIEARFGDDPPRPPFWGGYRLVPATWEFWQGRKSRLHDRIHYRRQDGQWLRERLAP